VQPGAAARLTCVTALTLENARLHGVTRSARRQLDEVRAVAAELTRTLDLQATLDLIVRRVGPLFGHGAGSVWLCEPGSERLVAAAADRTPAGEGAERLARAVAEVVAATRRGTLMDEGPRRADPGAGDDADPPHAVIGEPLLHQGRLLGVLVVAAVPPRRGFAADDAGLLQLFTHHASLAVANAQLFGQIQLDQEELQRMSRRLVEVQEAERRSLARELHDEIGQALTGLRMLLEASADAAPPDNRRRFLEAQELVRCLLSRVRQLSLDLRPSMLDDLGLLPAVLWLVEHYETRTGIRIDLRHTGLQGRRLPPDVETAAYRVVQEALTNVARHAGAAQATVRLCATRDVLEACVEDAGCGFDPGAQAPSSTGLSSMRERALLLGGQLVIDSAPGRGTAVIAGFPLFPRRQAAYGTPHGGDPAPVCVPAAVGPPA
jgi:signal transduction histidine kinase